MPIRWRNNGPPPRLLHIAGPVIACREWRRGCPGYIVDRRQTCDRCGVELVHGRWAVFFLEGSLVVEHGLGRGRLLHDLSQRDDPASIPTCDGHRARDRWPRGDGGAVKKLAPAADRIA